MGIRSRSALRVCGAFVVLVAVLLGSVTPAFATPGAVLWVKRYNPDDTTQHARQVAVSPDGSTVFVTGSGGGSTSYYATVAYKAGTGAVIWARRFSRPGDSYDEALALAVSPDGAKVFVTGFSGASASNYDYATVAYRAGTGAVVWTKRYKRRGDLFAQPVGVTVSPDSSKVFVTGLSDGGSSNGGADYATVAFRAGTGAVIWTRRYNGPANGDDDASALTISPDGSKVFVTGSSAGSTYFNYATVAYNAGTGAVIWTKRYHGPQPGGGDGASALTVSPDGSKVFVTGQSGFDYATIAYKAATGAVVWTKRYNGPGSSYDAASAVVVSPDGATVFVTGQSLGRTGTYDYATVAYNAGTGAVIWTQRYNGPASSSDDANAAAVSPDGTTVFVTGQSLGRTGYYDYATVAYQAGTGAVRWTQRYNGPASTDDQAYAVAVSPDSTKVFVTGFSHRSTGREDYATIAYSAT